MDPLARHKLEFLVSQLGRAGVAAVLGIRPARVTDWLARVPPDPADVMRLEAVEYVLSRLLRSYRPATALKWLGGFNAHLGDGRPIDLLRKGRTWEVIRAIEAEECAYA